jgi:hypothetical protein
VVNEKFDEFTSMVKPNPKGNELTMLIPVLRHPEETTSLDLPNSSIFRNTRLKSLDYLTF